MRKPPPTPKSPDKNPTPPPNARRRKTFTDISAMGR
jgi:hypothetical protein